MFREGHKEMTGKIAAGKITPADASSQLADVGVSTSADRLRKASVVAPGKSPTKAGRQPKLSPETEAAIHAEIRFLRQHASI